MRPHEVTPVSAHYAEFVCNHRTLAVPQAYRSRICVFVRSKFCRVCRAQMPSKEDGGCDIDVRVVDEDIEQAGFYY